MKFLKPEFHFYDIPDATDHDAVLQFLERIGRVCYKSEDKSHRKSAGVFLTKIKERKHWAMLEHYRFTFPIRFIDYKEYLDLYYLIDETSDSNLLEKLRFPNVSESGRIDFPYLMTGSATTFNYLAEVLHNIGVSNTNIIFRIHAYLHKYYPEITTDCYIPFPDDMKLRFLTREEIAALPVNLRRIHDFRTVWKCEDRGVTHEDVRMRLCSFAQESTRYVNYGKHGCQFIIPCWFTEQAKQLLTDYHEHPFFIGDVPMKGFTDPEWAWVRHMQTTENVYNYLLENGWAPQMARAALTHSTKAEIIITANPNEWIHYFNMRVPASAHPQMRELSRPMLKDCLKYDPNVYACCQPLLEKDEA